MGRWNPSPAPRLRRLPPTSSARSLPTTSAPASTPGVCTRVFRRNPTGICTSATPSRFASTSVWRPSSAASAISVTTTRIPRRKTSSTSSRSNGTSGGSGSTGTTASIYASDYFEALYEYAERLILDGKAYVDSLTADEIRDYRGTLTEPGRNSPYRDRSRGREPRPLPPHARRRISRRHARAPGQDRHGVAEHQHARSDAVPDSARHAPSYGRRLAASIRPTTTPIRSPTPSKTSPIRCARWSSKTTGPCTTG